MADIIEFPSIDPQPVPCAAETADGTTLYLRVPGACVTMMLSRFDRALSATPRQTVTRRS